MKWSEFPMLRLLIPLLLGISISTAFNLSAPLPLYVLILLGSIYFIIGIWYNKKLHFRYRWLPGVLLFTFILIAGYQLKVLKYPANNSIHFSHFLVPKSTYVGKVVEPLTEKENSYKTILSVILIKDSVWHQCNGKVVIYFKKDSAFTCLKPGSEILISAPINPIPPPANPEEFDYAGFMRNKGIYHSSYVTDQTCHITNLSGGNTFFQFIFQFRQQLLNRLKQAGMHASEYGVVSALLIGATDNLDPETIKDYQGSGAMHILSVSGMHVGVIFLVLNFLLLFMEKLPKGKIIKAILLIAFVWFYAILTGMSPSVMRAATMFSFISIGSALRRHSSIYNTLAASAFLLLLMNPDYITDVGFQLSYLAVVGIVAIYPPIYKLLTINIIWLDKLWSLVSVSIAAQIITAPLSMYYFHQFPNYFILTNIVAVPLSALVIYGGILYLLVASIPFIGIWIGKILQFLMWLLNTSIGYIEELPYSVSRDISINLPQMILLYALVVLLMIALIKRRGRIMLLSFSVITAFLIIGIYNTVNLQSQQKIIVYHINKSTAIEYYHNGEALRLLDTNMINNEKKQNFHLDNHRIKNRIKNSLVENIYSQDKKSKKNWYKNSNIMNLGGKRLLILNSNHAFSEKIKIDYLLVSHNPKVNMEKTMQTYQPELIILDGSNSKSTTKRWTNFCDIYKYKYHNTALSGAWILTF